jgi:hypothetical protein
MNVVEKWRKRSEETELKLVYLARVGYVSSMTHVIHETSLKVVHDHRRAPEKMAMVVLVVRGFFDEQVGERNGREREARERKWSTRNDRLVETNWVHVASLIVCRYDKTSDSLCEMPLYLNGHLCRLHQETG